jgi:hypothetical protein
LTTRLFVEIFIEADFDALPEERRRFALINIPATFSAKPPPQERERLRNFVVHLRLAERVRHFRLNSVP